MSIAKKRQKSMPMRRGKYFCVILDIAPIDMNASMKNWWRKKMNEKDVARRRAMMSVVWVLFWVRSWMSPGRGMIVLCFFVMCFAYSVWVFLGRSA